jgi:hypothetical protein
VSQHRDHSDKPEKHPPNREVEQVLVESQSLCLGYRIVAGVLTEVGVGSLPVCHGKPPLIG